MYYPCRNYRDREGKQREIVKKGYHIYLANHLKKNVVKLSSSQIYEM